MFKNVKFAIQTAIAIVVVTQTLRGFGMMGRDIVHVVEDRYFSKK